MRTQAYIVVVPISSYQGHHLYHLAKYKPIQFVYLRVKGVSNKTKENMFQHIFSL